MRMHPAHSSTPAVFIPVTHYENFPVASWLCPPRLRAPIAAIYHFARTADDLADEGCAPPAQRLAALAAYRADLLALGSGAEAAMLTRSAWPQVFVPLAQQVRAHTLPLPLLDNLLSAFAQDVRKTAAGTSYADRAELLDYCRRSANPIGRLLLHLYAVHDAQSLARSDAICSALQLINFWQDLSVDLPRARHYLTDADCAAHGVARAQLRAQPSALTPALRALLAEQSAWARSLMHSGAALVHRLPGRIGWELRLVVQAGLRILDKIDALQGANLYQRPRITGSDTALLLWRAFCMRPDSMKK